MFFFKKKPKYKILKRNPHKSRQFEKVLESTAISFKFYKNTNFGIITLLLMGCMHCESENIKGNEESIYIINSNVKI